MDETLHKKLAHRSWNVKEYFCVVDRCQARKSQSQRAHILPLIRAFLRLEMERLRTGWGRFESKREITHEAIRGYIISPHYMLSHVSTA